MACTIVTNVTLNQYFITTGVEKWTSVVFFLNINFRSDTWNQSYIAYEYGVHSFPWDLGFLLFGSISQVWILFTLCAHTFIILIWRGFNNLVAFRTKQIHLLKFWVQQCCSGTLWEKRRLLRGSKLQWWVPLTRVSALVTSCLPEWYLSSSFFYFETIIALIDSFTCFLALHGTSCWLSVCLSVCLAYVGVRLTSAARKWETSCSRHCKLLNRLLFCIEMEGSKKRKER